MITYKMYLEIEWALVMNDVRQQTSTFKDTLQKSHSNAF